MRKSKATPLDNLFKRSFQTDTGEWMSIIKAHGNSDIKQKHSGIAGYGFEKNLPLFKSLFDGCVIDATIMESDKALLTEATVSPKNNCGKSEVMGLLPDSYSMVRYFIQKDGPVYTILTELKRAL